MEEIDEVVESRGNKAAIGGYFIGDWVSFKIGYMSREGLGIIGTLVFLGLSLLGIKLFSPRLESKVGFELALTELVN